MLDVFSMAINDQTFIFLKHKTVIERLGDFSHYIIFTNIVIDSFKKSHYTRCCISIRKIDFFYSIIEINTISVFFPWHGGHELYMDTSTSEMIYTCPSRNRDRDFWQFLGKWQCFWQFFIFWQFLHFLQFFK